MIILVREIGGRELIPTPTVTLGIAPMLRGVKEVAGAAQPFKLEQERALPIRAANVPRVAIHSAS